MAFIWRHFKLTTALLFVVGSLFGQFTGNGVIGVIASSIQVGGSTFTGLLDTVPDAGFFYSLRRVNSAYTGDLLTVRRASDDAEQSIGYVADTLDRASIESFCSGTTCYVPLWNDQSGNGRDALGWNESTTNDNLPIIVNAGTTVTLNGRIAIYCPHPRAFFWTDASTDISDLITAVGGGGGTKAGTAHVVGYVGSTPTDPYLFALNDPGGDEYWWLYSDGNARIEFNSTAASMGADITRDAQTIWCGRVTGTTFEVFENGSSIGSSTNGSSQTSTTTEVEFKFGGGSFSSRTIDGYYQEIGSWKTSENVTTLYNSANAYW